MSRNLLKVALLALISLAGCSLVRDQAYNLGYKDRRALDTLRKQPLYSLKANGVFDQKDHELILFDGDTLTMRFSYMINGVENSAAEYSVEVIEDSSALEGVYRLYGAGPFSGQYLGMTLLTNNNGAYAKLKFQDSPDSVLEGARAQAEWNWVTDPLAFRSFKTFPVDVPVVYLSDANASTPAVGGTNASTTQRDLRFIKLAHPDQLSHTNVIASVNANGTPNLSDDIYTLTYNEVWPNGKTPVGPEVSEKIVTYEIRSVRMIAPNTEIYGVVIKDIGAGYTSSPVATPGSPFTVGAAGYLAIEFSYDADRVKTASRMVFDVIEINALTEMQRRPLFRWESISTADLPTRVLDRFNGQPIVRVAHYTTDEITPGRKAEIPLAYNAENTREFQFDITNFSVRVLDVVNRVTNATTYRFRMVDDTSSNEGVIQLQGSVGTLAGQYFHFRHYYPAAGELTHGYNPPNETFLPGTGAPGTSRPANDTRLMVKIGQGIDEAAAKLAVNTAVHADAAKITYQSKTNAYKPHRLFVNMHKRGGSWVGVQDDGNYNTEAATNWSINSISRVVQIRIATNAAPRFSTYRVHTLIDVSDNRIVAVLSNIKNQTAPGDMRDNFLEPSLDPVFPNPDNDASREELSPFHGKYVALELGTGVDNTRAKVEYADSLSEVLKKLDNRTAWNLYESTAVPTPNRIIKTLAGSSPWIRLDADGYFNSTHTERFNFDADDMTATIFWHRGTAASLNNNIVAAAKYAIPLPMEADTSLQEGVFVMRGGADAVVQVPIPGAPAGTFHPLPTDPTVLVGGVQLEAEDSGAYKYADRTVNYYYSALVGALADANKARVGKGLSRVDAEAARAALGSRWIWHTLADAPLSPGVILHLMRTTAENGNSPLITSETAFDANAATGMPTAGFSYKPYATYEYEFANSPSLQVTIRRIQDTTTTTAIYPLVIVNNVDRNKTIVRLGGTANLGNYAPGRFMLVRIPSDVDTTAANPADRKYATNAAVSVFPTQADAENYTGLITAIPIGQLPNSADFDAKYNLRLKKTVAFSQAQLPFGKSYQLLLPHKIGANEFYDTYDIFNPNFLGSAFVRFTNLATAPATDYRIDVKDANNLDYSSYTYEVMAETPGDNTLYVKLNGEGGLYHNRFAAFRFNAAHTANPNSMHAVIGQGVFADLSTALAGQKATETTTGWRYRSLDVLTNKDFLTFKALARADKDSLRVGSFVRVDKNGVYRSQDTDIFRFDFPTAAGESVTNMQVSVTVKKPDGTENTGRYYFVPLKNTPANDGIGANHGASPGTGAGVNDIHRGYLMYGYLISVNFGVDGSPALVPYNKHFVILRTDVTNNPAAPATDPNYDRVRSVIVATNSSSLGLPADAAAETGAATAYALYNFWWRNGTTPIGANPIPSLAFNFRAQASTDINSRIIDHMAVNRWVTLSNIPANSFAAGSAALRYAYDVDNHQIWDFNALSRRVTITTVNAGGAPTAATYDITMRTSDNDYEGYVQLSSSTISDPYNQKFVYLQVPGGPGETAATIDRRSRDARIIMGDSSVIGNGAAIVANNLTALQAARTAIIAEAPAPADGEWNAANADLATLSEKSFESFHRRNRAFFTYETGTAAVDPSANNRDSSDQWNKDHWLAFMPLVRQRGAVDSKITNLLLQRKGLAGGTDYNYTNVIKLMQADAGRTVLQLAGTNAQATPSVNFSNLFMGVEYGNDVNDRTAKVVYSSTRAGVIEALNLRTTYNYFDSEMATNSKNNEQLMAVALGLDRGFEWVQVSNSIHNPAGATPPGIAGLPGPYNPALAATDNIVDGDTYDKIRYNAAATTNFVIDPANKVVREMRIDGSATNIFVYGYTVIESGLVPNLGGTTIRQANTRYRFVIRLEGFGDYKNYFAAGEIGRFDASAADPTPDPISKGSTTTFTAADAERYKVRMIFGKNVAQAKELLKYLQGSSSLAGAPVVGTWNLVSKTILTMPSPLLDATDTATGYPTAPTTRRQSLNARTGDPSLIDPAQPAATVNPNYYARLASATGLQNNVLDADNHTNFAFWNENSEPVVFITTVQSNVSSTVRYKAIVKENYFKADASAGSRRTNDVIIWLDNLGSPLHSQFIGIRRHTLTPNAVHNDLKGDYFSMIIDPSETVVQNAMGALSLVAGDPALTRELPMLLRFSNDMTRALNGDNPYTSQTPPFLPNKIIDHFTSPTAGPFASLDTDGIYMNLSNAQWNYNPTTKLMTITYTSDTGLYDDAFTGVQKSTAESYRVIPVLTITNDANNSRGSGVVLFRSDISGGAPAGSLHNRYIGIIYHGNEVATAHTGADLVFLNHRGSISTAISDLAGASDAAQFTVIRPYIGMDLSPLNYMDAVRDPDNPANLQGVWATLDTGAATTKRYQLDPSNTTLYRVDVSNRILYEEKVVTTLVNSPVNDYSGTPQRSATQYRINLVRSIPSSIDVGYRNYPEQLTFTAIKPKAYAPGDVGPVSRLTLNSAPSATNEKYFIVRTKKRTSGANASPVVWADISAEALYIGSTDRTSGSSHTAINSFLDNPINSDPYGVAAFTTSVNREALNYWNVFMGQNDWWFMTTPKNTFATNTFNPTSGANADNMALVFDANTGNGGNSHGDGGLTQGVVNVNVGFQPLDMVTGDVQAARVYSQRKMLNFWQRLIRQVDADTFIFQLHGGQDMRIMGYTNNSSDGISYAAANVRSAVSNKYWIVRAGQGVDLFRSRITNGSTPAEALQNLGLLTSPNLSADRSLNRTPYTNIPKGVDFIGNAEIDPLGPTAATAAAVAALSPADQIKLYAARSPQRLEVDNHTNWNFGSDLNDPSVTITIRSNVAGVVGEQTVTYGFTPLYTTNVPGTPLQGLYALTGFGPFAGRVLSLVVDKAPNADHMRILMAPASLSRGLTAGGATNTNLGFLLSSIYQTVTRPAQSEYTWRASVSLGVTNWHITDYNNFTRRSLLNVDAGILSHLDNAGNRIVFKTGAFSAANPNLIPKRIYDPDATTNYAVDISTSPPTIMIQPVGESAVNYPMGGASLVETIASHPVMGDNGTNITTSATLGSVRLGTTTEYLGIKILTTNAGTPGNAGIHLIRRTDAAADALDNTLAAVRNAAAVPNHDYIKNVPSSRRLVEEINKLGSIIRLTDFRTFDDRNYTEYIFDSNSRAVQVIELENGGVKSATSYTAVVIRDFEEALASTIDRSGIVLLKGTGPLANKLFAVKQQHVAAGHLSGQNNLRANFGDTTNDVFGTGANSVNSTASKKLDTDIEPWVYHKKAYFTGGGVDGTSAAPNGTSINLKPFERLSSLYKGRWARLRRAENPTNNLKIMLSQFTYDSGDTVEYEFEYQRKLALQRDIKGIVTNVRLFALWLTNDNAGTTPEWESLDDRDVISMYHIGNILSNNIMAGNTRPITIADLANIPLSNMNAASNPAIFTTDPNAAVWALAFKFAKHGNNSADPANNLSLADITEDKVYAAYIFDTPGTMAVARTGRRADEGNDPYDIPYAHAKADYDAIVNLNRLVAGGWQTFPGKADNTPALDGGDETYIAANGGFLSFDFNQTNWASGTQVVSAAVVSMHRMVGTFPAANLSGTIGVNTNHWFRFSSTSDSSSFILQPIEIDGDKLGGVVRFAFGRSSAALGDTNQGNARNNFYRNQWHPSSSYQPLSFIGTNRGLTNLFMAFRIGDGANALRGKFAYGSTPSQAKAALNAITFFNMWSMNANVSNSGTPAMVNTTFLGKGNGWRGPIRAVVGDTDNYIVKVADPAFQTVNIYKDGTPASIGNTYRLQMLWEVAGFNTTTDFRYHDDGPLNNFDVFTGQTIFDRDGNAVLKTYEGHGAVFQLIGFGPLGGKLLRTGGEGSSGSSATRRMVIGDTLSHIRAFTTDPRRPATNI